MALLQMKPPVNYGEQQAFISNFLQNFKIVEASDILKNLSISDTSQKFAPAAGNKVIDHSQGQNEPGEIAEHISYKYMTMLKEISDRKRNHILIELDDLAKFEKAARQNGQDVSVASSIERNTLQYIEIFCRAIDALLPESTSDPSFKEDVIDIVKSQRARRNEKILQAIESDVDIETPTAELLFPPELTRAYQLNFKPVTISTSNDDPPKALAVRNIRGEHIGHLITARGIVTRVSDVKPAVLVNAYACDRCGFEIFQPVTTKQFAPLVECISEECKKSNSRGQLFHSTRSSKFVPFQEVKLQEMSDQVPVGDIPRQLTIQAHGTLCRQMNPGDVVDIAGIFLSTPYTGFKGIRAGLLTDTYLEAQWVNQHKKAYSSIVLSDLTLSRMQTLEATGQLYESLSRSIAPEIFGHFDVKKILLLQLIGGVTKEVGDGMRIRGDINVCLMGDPGVAKSQLLKYITKVSPRAVYTTGRGSSGVGLTAAVMRDPVTDEMILEGGALVLADNGMCCIDEFDKMDDADRTAIHEVMEQQTISISKAGINTTLNARTSILAAANPLYGRYNPRISPMENINLPAALLSRFDVLFLMLDTPDRDVDEELARHVTYVHIHNRHPAPATADGIETIFSPAEMRQWVARARGYRPVVSRVVADYCIGAYVRMRAQYKRDENSKHGAFTHTSPRSLLAVLRLSQALARLRFSNEVILEDVDEALRLIAVSKASLFTDESDLVADQQPMSKIYSLIKGMMESGAAAVTDGSEMLDMRRLRERVLARGFTVEQFDDCIDEYAMLDVWHITPDGSRLVFIQSSR